MRRRQVYAARAAAEQAASVPKQPEAVSLEDDPAAVLLSALDMAGIKVRKKPGPKPGSKRKH